MTSVIGHVFALDFLPQFQSWEVDPKDLFYAGTKKSEANPKACSLTLASNPGNNNQLSSHSSHSPAPRMQSQAAGQPAARVNMQLPPAGPSLFFYCTR